VKILGKGELNKAITVKANAFSQAAKERIEKAGGKVEIIEFKNPRFEAANIKKAKESEK